MADSKTETSFFKRVKDTFHFMSIWKPMIYTIVFAVIYNFLYLKISDLAVSSAIRNLLSVLWACVYGLTWYFVCGLAWGKKRGTLKARPVLYVLCWLLAWYLLAVFALMPMYTGAMLSGSFFLLLAVQLLAAGGLIVFIPCTILYFKAVYEEQYGLKALFSSIWNSARAHLAPVFNSWLLLLVLMIAWDSLVSGPLTIYFGVDAVSLFISLLFMGNPFFFAVLLISLTAGQLVQAYIYLIMLSVAAGLLFTWLEVNLIVYIGKWYQPLQNR